MILGIIGTVIGVYGTIFCPHKELRALYLLTTICNILFVAKGIV